MLTEFQEVKQIAGEGKRRWFQNDYFDLIIWYVDNSGELAGFQLCYDKNGYERSLTYTEDLGYTHMAIDSGESGPLSNDSPILVTDGLLDERSLYLRFKDESSNVDPAIREYVLNKINEYTIRL